MIYWGNFLNSHPHGKLVGGASSTWLLQADTAILQKPQEKENSPGV